MSANQWSQLTKIGFIVLALLIFTNNQAISASDSEHRETASRVFVSTAIVKNDSSGLSADSCKLGPKILNVFNVSASYLTGQFYGVEVFKISWYIRDAKGSTVRQGEESPVNSSPLITFKPLPPGNYTLVYQGKSCVSAPSSKSFVIPDSKRSAETNARQSADMPKTVAKGMDEHMKLTITRADDVYMITDEAMPSLTNGYEFRYMIGAEVITSDKPLKNYIFAGNNPFRIWKMKTKVGLASVNQWASENNHYFSTTAAEAFSYNTTAAFNTFVFPGVHDKTGFINPVLPGFDPSMQNSQWADIAPDMKLPPGHVWVANPGAWVVEKVMAKGVTHIANHMLPWKNTADVIKLKEAGVTYNNVPRIEHFMHLKETGKDKSENGYNLRYWPNGPLTKEQAIQKANEADINDAIWIGETMEGNSYMPPEKEMWAHFYKRLRERYTEKWGKRNIPFFIAHNYFSFWPEEISLSGKKPRAYYKNLLHLSPAALPKTNFSPGGTLSATNLIPEAVYIGAPDMQQGQVYESIFRMQIIKNLGYETGIFLFGVHEWRPNNPYQYNYPEGRFFAPYKLPLDPNVIIANGFIAQVFGKMYIEWGAADKVRTKTFDKEWVQGNWFPNGATEPQPGFPYFKKPGDDSYPGYTGSADLSYFSQKLYHDTFARVDGGVRKFLKHRIDGGKWIDPSQFSTEEIVDAYYDKRGFVFSETKNGRTAWFYLNSFADNKWHDIEVQLPDGTLTRQRIAGNGIHAKIN
jgi:hypothetical protein